MSQYLLIAMLSFGALAAADAQQKTIREVPARTTQSNQGVDLYREYCAVCHGVSGKGDGPAASATKKHPTDLTQLTRTHAGKFPTLAVQTSIKGNNSIVEHGTGEMPVWGSILNQSGEQKGLGEMRVMALVKYVEGLQAK
uniref:Cytochrome c domain-containing protein n=1 Tax=Solibacter usitatus (strain Ellin6076) TaxID=234267 RepID=Q01YH4_SOLUE